jgi:hypothetical protein
VRVEPASMQVRDYPRETRGCVCKIVEKSAEVTGAGPHAAGEFSRCGFCCVWLTHAAAVATGSRYDIFTGYLLTCYAVSCDWYTAAIASCLLTGLDPASRPIGQYIE